MHWDYSFLSYMYAADISVINALIDSVTAPLNPKTVPLLGYYHLWLLLSINDERYTLYQV